MVCRETGIARELVVLLLVSAPVLCQHLHENVCLARCCSPRLENTLGALIPELTIKAMPVHCSLRFSSDVLYLQSDGQWLSDFCLSCSIGSTFSVFTFAF